MDELLGNGDSIVQLREGEVITAKINTIDGGKLSLDLGPHGLGMVPRREVSLGKTYEVGEEVDAMVVDSTSEDGFITMSIKRASRDKGWELAYAAASSGDSVTVVPFDCNKGGLLVEFEGSKGFLPVSQLGQDKYPKLSGDQDKSAIAEHIKQFVGKPIEVKVIAADKEAAKLIFSEREVGKQNVADKIKEFEIGQDLKAKVTGVVDYGVFVDADGVEGMVHISEISWKRVSSPADIIKEGDVVDVKVISLDNGRLGLSIKQLLPDPWDEETGGLKVGDKIKAKVTRITPFGAFVQATPSIEALVHISEVPETEASGPESVFVLGKEQEFEILEINNETRRMFLGVPGVKNRKARKSSKPEEVDAKKLKTESEPKKEAKISKTKKAEPIDTDEKATKDTKLKSKTKDESEESNDEPKKKPAKKSD